MNGKSIIQNGGIPSFSAPVFGDVKPQVKYSCKRCGKESEDKSDLCKPQEAK